MKSPYRTTVDLILDAVRKHVGEDGMKSSFLFSINPDASLMTRNFGITIFFSLKGMTKAALFVRDNGPAYLRALSIDDIRSMLQKFLTNNFHDVGCETFLRDFKESYAVHVSEPTKEALAKSLAASQIFSPTDMISLFPLVPVQVMESYTSDMFFLRAPGALNMEFPPDFRRYLVSDAFPPVDAGRFPTKKPNAWLGTRAPIPQASIKMKSAILGAAALTLPLKRRYMFSLRKIFGGVCTFDDGSSFTSGEPHTPPLANDLIIRQCDQDWLTILTAKLTSTATEDRRHVRALEYFYRAWSLGPSERFPILCMALDATYGEAGRATQSIIDGVQSVLGTHVNEKRLRLLMQIRASVIHGGAPDVYDSPKYRKYYEAYSVDPIDDLDEVVTESLRRRIFERTMILQDDPNAKAAARMQTEGQLPTRFNPEGILNNLAPNA